MKSDMEHLVYFSTGLTNEEMECISFVEDKMTYCHPTSTVCRDLVDYETMD